MSSVVRFAINQLMLALQGVAMELTTDPHPMGDNNYVELLWNIHALDGVAGTTVTATLTVQVSNDGTTWMDSTLTSNQTSVPTAPVEVNGNIRAAFIRMVYSLDVTGGSADDVGVMAFDVHANLLKSGS